MWAYERGSSRWESMGHVRETNLRPVRRAHGQCLPDVREALSPLSLSSIVLWKSLGTRVMKSENLGLGLQNWQIYGPEKFESTLGGSRQRFAEHSCFVAFTVLSYRFFRAS